MAVTPLSRLLEIESAHAVCFDRNGDEKSWSDFAAAVARVAAGLADTDDRYWAIDVADAFEFAAALYGCWVAGKTPVLAPSHMLDGRAEFDGIINSGFGNEGDLTNPIIPSESDLVLFTSGSTGEPTKVYRTIRNLEAELDVLDALFGDRIGDGRIYSTVSQEHVYGLLFRLLWPLASRRPFATFNFEFPENLLTDVAGEGALVTSPALLKRIGHLDEAAACSWRIIFSSGGMLPDYAARDAQRLLGTWPIEVLGSTETSGVAWRTQAEQGAAESWQVLPEVRVRQDEEGFLEVSSPFMGLSHWHRMGDKVQLESNRMFELLGRGDHIVKIEEKRVSLAEIEQRAVELPDVTDAAATALEEGARQFIGLVVQLSDAGLETLETKGRRDLGQKLRSALGSKLDALAVPKKLRYVDVIPVNSQGKRQPDEIRALFDGQ